MRLITEKGQIVLPVDFEFEIEEHSPVFSNKGAQSLPVNLPDQVNDIVLSHPSRPGKSAKLVRKIPAKLEAGIIHKSGQLIIDTAQSGKGITGAIMINESDLYSQIKEMTLSEVFEKIVRTDFTTPQAWYNHIYSCMTGASSDDFTAFPVAVDLQEANYQMLNSPDVTSETTPWALMWSARRTAYGSDAVNVPAGYGITPFLWLWRALELLFADFGYSVSKNPFKTDLLLQKIVLVNNTADSICKGELNYADLVPSCKISEFIKFIEQKFSTHLYVYPEAKIIDIIPVADVITSTPQMDVTPFLDGSEEYIFSELQELDITSDTSLEGASPAAETIFDLANKYSHLSELDEHDFRNNAWRYNLVLRRATGEYYEILQKYNTTSIKKVRLGTNYFRHFTNRLPAKECNSADMIPPMVDMNFGISGAKERRVICPYIGSSQHRNTSYKDQQKGGEQKIIIALFAGLSDEDSNIEAKYCLGTTQKYSNLGNQWSAFDLTSSDIYDLFHKEWNKVLMNSGVSVEAKVDYSPENLLALRLDRPVILKGQQLLPKRISYSVGKSLTNITSEYLLLKHLSPILEDLSVSFLPQTYRWQYESNAGEIFSPFDTQEWDNYTWEYVGQSAPSSQAYEFIPAPTQAQYDSEELYFQQINSIKITAKKINESTLYYFDRELSSGFRAVLIDD